MSKLEYKVLFVTPSNPPGPEKDSKPKFERLLNEATEDGWKPVLYDYSRPATFSAVLVREKQ